MYGRSLGGSRGLGLCAGRDTSEVASHQENSSCPLLENQAVQCHIPVIAVLLHGHPRRRCLNLELRRRPSAPALGRPPAPAGPATQNLLETALIRAESSPCRRRRFRSTTVGPPGSHKMTVRKARPKFPSLINRCSPQYFPRERTSCRAANSRRLKWNPDR